MKAQEGTGNLPSSVSSTSQLLPIGVTTAWTTLLSPLFATASLPHYPSLPRNPYILSRDIHPPYSFPLSFSPVLPCPSPVSPRASALSSSHYPCKRSLDSFNFSPQFRDHDSKLFMCFIKDLSKIYCCVCLFVIARRASFYFFSKIEQILSYQMSKEGWIFWKFMHLRLPSTEKSV